MHLIELYISYVIPTLSGIIVLIQGLSHVTSLTLKTVIRNDACITCVDYARVELATSALWEQYSNHHELIVLKE